MSRYATSTDRPGICVSPGPSRTSRSTTIVKANVPTNVPTASWLRRSSSSARTIRGENCPIASWTTTSVTVSTSVVSETSEVAKVLSTVWTTEALPVTPSPMSP